MATNNPGYGSAIVGAAQQAPSNGNVTVSVGNITNSPLTTYHSISASGMFNGTWPSPSKKDIITFYNINGSEIVRLNNDGSVTWSGNIRINDAAEAFSRTLTLGAEAKAGLTRKVKSEMRDTVFEEIISITKEKGPLTVEDLTYFLQAAKIMDKLRGGEE